MQNLKQNFTVGELTRLIKTTLEQSFSSITLQGEISNFKIHTSGHAYFTIKDAEAQIQAVMWRSRVGQLYFTPQDGMSVVARGGVTVYPPRGQYQFDVVQLKPAGIGELQLAFEKLKQKLSTEGLFDSSHKRSIPRYPSRIGIVTSPTGAALRDIIQIITRRYPFVELIVAPVKVQGAGAAEEIADAIRSLNRAGAIDVMIVGRGGGSLEDLWAFNEEAVARAIYDSQVPVISAVGHEVDVTIADYVSDLRAPTPSAAAELVVPHKDEIVGILHNFSYTAEQLVRSRLDAEKEAISSLLRGYAFRRPADLLHQFSQTIDELVRSLGSYAGHRISLLRERHEALSGRMLSLNPETVLRRGYAMVVNNGRAIGSSTALRSGDEIGIRFHDGEVPATVKDNQ